ncbi:MAG: DOMON domain-containing protein [Brevinematales bacterium]
MKWFFVLGSVVWGGLLFADAIEVNEIRLAYEVVSNEVIFTIEAPTTGWVAVGWGATTRMKDADFLIGYVTNGNHGVVEDHFGVSVTSHRRDTELGGGDNFRLIEAFENNGKTRLVIARVLNTKDTYDVPLEMEKPIDVILAYGKIDNTKSKHVGIGKAKMILKRK